MGGGKAPKEWVRKYEEENNQKLFDDKKYCPKCNCNIKANNLDGSINCPNCGYHFQINLDKKNEQ